MKWRQVESEREKEGKKNKKKPQNKARQNKKGIEEGRVRDRKFGMMLQVSHLPTVEQRVGWRRKVNIREGIVWGRGSNEEIWESLSRRWRWGGEYKREDYVAIPK